MVVVVFRSRVRKDADLAALEPLGRRMYELASAMPGFISYKDFSAEDGEGVSIVEFEDEAAVRAWYEHPEHKAAQAKGRSDIFSEYRVQVCTPYRERRM